jgi:hypothetical protein
MRSELAFASVVSFAAIVKVSVYEFIVLIMASCPS